MSRPPVMETSDYPHRVMFLLYQDILEQHGPTNYSSIFPGSNCLLSLFCSLYICDNTVLHLDMIMVNFTWNLMVLAALGNILDQNVHEYPCYLVMNLYI